MSISSRYLLLIDMGVMLVIFAICQVVQHLARYPTHIAGNRLDLVMTDVPDIVDVVVGTPLGALDHCFICCVLCIEKSVPEYIVRSNLFLKHRANYHSVRRKKW